MSNNCGSFLLDDMLYTMIIEQTLSVSQIQYVADLFRSVCDSHDVMTYESSYAYDSTYGWKTEEEEEEDE